ncbi:hypothetical protein NG99_26185 [Erwinia typographi]|uniref:Bacteriophage protein n=1 Tax=Erwinia typographi TaxID=371042 RepID=A0A0A3YL59_9GAMM|nr:hypothetical protein [Erwinia typographi]KGT86254.1 hypothetical protein NG99_26185 [Erwinia typographi]
MIEQAIKTALGTLSGLPVYPLLLPDPVQEGVTFQRISDPEMDNGLVRTGLIAGRFQISLYRLNDYTALVELDRAIWSAWRGIRQGEIAGYPVQYVERGGIQQSCVTLTSNQVQYRLVRDFIIYFSEGTS